MIIEADNVKFPHKEDLYESQYKGLQQLSDWWNSNELEATLKGYAGTGKTYLLKYFIKHVVNRAFTITAPTHKALRVLEEHINIKGKTLQSLHGLKPDVDMANFDIDNLNFNAIGLPKMQNYSLVIIDESSMINKDLFELNRRRAKEYGTKVLYVGDPLQLPPVNEKESEVFNNVKTVIELTKIVRQGKDNSLLDLFELLRDDIRNNTSTCLTHMVNHPDGISNGVGYKMVRLGEYKDLMLEYYNSDNFFSNLNYVRSMAYTNIMTNTWNNFIRNNIFTTQGNSIIAEDLLTAYKTLVDDNNAPIITNSEDYIINQITPYRNEYKINVNCVILKSSFDLRTTDMLQIVEHNDLDNMAHYTELLTKLRSNAIRTGGKKGWYPYYKFKNQVLCMQDLQIAGKKLPKEIDYGYTLTTHKLQGSTFENVFIDGFDICQPMTKYGRTMPNEINLRNRLLYVALSRAKNIAYIKF